MGRATRWFKNLFGSKKEIEQRENSNVEDHNDKKRWSFKKIRSNNSGEVGMISGTIPVNIPPAEAAWLRSFYSDSENEQNKHAIAVAAATAAAADAAVAAAQAAVAVVRLTSHGRGTMFNGGRERWAAVVIQTFFRGFLARKALRALKGLVKIQALVRGYLVRKQASATLYSMQALIRAQATVRSRRARSFSHKDHQFQPEFRSRKSLERVDQWRNENTSFHQSRRLSASIETEMNNFNESPKIVEMDTYRPKSRSQRTSTSKWENCEAPFPCKTPARLSIPDSRNYPEFDWGFMRDEYRISTAQSTPRFLNSSLSNLPATPAKSVCADSFFRKYSNFPNYMANTQSFKAKVRSSSAPKQRPESIQRKKISLNELVESRASLSGIKMRKSCHQAQEVLDFKNTIMAKINDKSSEIVYEEDEGDYIRRKW